MKIITSFISFPWSQINITESRAMFLEHISHNRSYIECQNMFCCHFLQHNTTQGKRKKKCPFLKQPHKKIQSLEFKTSLNFPHSSSQSNLFQQSCSRKWSKQNGILFPFFSFFNFNFSECGLLWEDVKGLKRFKKTNWIFLRKKRKKKLKWSLRLAFSLKFLCSLCLKLKRKATDRTWFRTYRFWELYIFSTCRENNGLIFIFYFYF